MSKKPKSQKNQPIPVTLEDQAIAIADEEAAAVVARAAKKRQAAPVKKPARRPVAAKKTAQAAAAAPEAPVTAPSPGDPSRVDAAKECRRCHQTLALEMFYRDKSQKDGLHPWCKPCNKAYEADRLAKRAAEAHNGGRPPGVLRGARDQTAKQRALAAGDRKLAAKAMRELDRAMASLNAFRASLRQLGIGA